MAVLPVLGVPHLVADDPAAQRKVVTVSLSSLDALYADLRFILDLVGDPRSFKDLKDTMDLSFDGIDPTRPCEVGSFVTAGGLQTIIDLPAANVADFKKFLQALSDADVRTASSVEQAPAAIRLRLKGIKLQPNERVIVSTYDGFIRFDAGSIRLGPDLNLVRQAREPSPPNVPASTLTFLINGESSTTDTRRNAFAKSRQKTLTELQKDDDSSDAAFAFRKAALDCLLATRQLVASESSRASMGWTIAHEQARATIRGEIVPHPETSLEQDVRRIGHRTDSFARVSKENAVLSVSCNAPIPPVLGSCLKALVARGRDLEHERIDHAVESASEKSADRAFADLAFDVFDNLSSMTDCNAVIRSWSHGKGALTTVAAVRLGDARGLRTNARQLANRRVIESPEGVDAIEISTTAVCRWRSEAVELFDREGTVLIGFSDEVVWFAVGENALERLRQSIQQARTRPESASDVALDVQLQMGPISDIWNNIHARQLANAEKNVQKKPRDKKVTEEKASIELVRSILTDLNVPQLAAETYRTGPSRISFELKREDDRVRFQADFDEGTLRLVGKALSRFVKDNL